MGFFYTFLLFFSVYGVSVYSYEYVPVYMWDTSKNYSLLPALGRINDEFFRDILLDKLSKDKVVLVFLEENLSPEDFTTYDSAGNNVFYALSHIKNEAQVNYYPFVEAPLGALQSLPGVKVSTVDVTPDGLPPNTKVEPGQVLIVDLNDAKENEDRSHMLSRHDSLIASIHKSVAAKYKNILAMFTARHSSWLVASELEGNPNSRKARHLLAAEEEDDKYKYVINSTSVLMYTQSPIIVTVYSKEANFTNPTIEHDSETNGTVVLNIVNVDKDKNEEENLEFTFKQNLGYWYLTDIAGNVETNFSFPVKNVFAPIGFSYHCHNSTFGNENVTVYMPGLQVQPFRGNDSKFGDAYDCIGFTTAPIWSGIFVTFILAMIMTFGLSMIMDIKTMDRFDDPKGKTISINVVE